MMDSRPSHSGAIFSAVLFFILCTTISILLLVTAALVWLSDVLGSFVVAAAALGVVAAVVAWLIYIVSLRDALERLRVEIATVYEVARTVKGAYEWVTERAKLLLALFGR